MNHEPEVTPDVVSEPVSPEVVVAAAPTPDPTGSGSEPADVRSSAPTGPPITWRETLSMVLLVVLCDLTIYRGQGFAGYALLFAVAPLLLMLGTAKRTPTRSLIVVIVMLALLMVKLVWCGSGLLVGLGFGLLAAVAMTLSGRCPYIVELAHFALHTLWSGGVALLQYNRVCKRKPSAGSGRGSSGSAINVVLPVVALFVFGFIFVLANPDLLASFSEWFMSLFERLEVFFSQIAEWLHTFEWFEVAFWGVTAWISLGLLRPWAGAFYQRTMSVGSETQEPTKAPLYAAFRNTLLTVIGLFTAYLVFEFQTLWFREFPEGFYYAGYAHEGAAWLTVALALATATLSLVFRGGVLSDPRLNRLRRLAWVWSALNLLLAVSVYNRMFIYIGYNGLTSKRMIGLFGISLVSIGFVLVVMKIVRNHDAVWLIRRHLLAFCLTVYLFAITPVDMLVMRYNVAKILQGNEMPSVQITVQEIGPEGILELRPLLQCDNPIIRQGIGAMLAGRLEEAEQAAEWRQSFGWTAFQAADQRVLQQLRASQAQWPKLETDWRRDQAWQEFVKYARPWF